MEKSHMQSVRFTTWKDSSSFVDFTRIFFQVVFLKNKSSGHLVKLLKIIFK